MIPTGHNGSRSKAIIEYAHEVAVPYALFIFDGTELYGNRLHLSSANNDDPLFYAPKDRMNGPPAPPPFDCFDDPAPPANMILNVSNTSSPSEPNFEALLRMGQSMLIPPPMGFGGNMPIPPFGFNTNDNGFQPRQDYRDHQRERGSYRDFDRGNRDNSGRRHDRDHHHKHNRR